MSLLLKEEIMEIIPHRPPFLLLDTIEELEKGKYAIGRKRIDGNDPVFQGHFPNEPIMPGVLILEALAQTGAVALLSADADRGKKVYFGGIKNAKFKNPVLPEDVLEMRTELILRKGTLGIAKAKACVEGKEVCTAELILAIF